MGSSLVVKSVVLSATLVLEFLPIGSVATRRDCDDVFAVVDVVQPAPRVTADAMNVSLPPKREQVSSVEREGLLVCVGGSSLLGMVLWQERYADVKVSSVSGSAKRGPGDDGLTRVVIYVLSVVGPRAQVLAEEQVVLPAVPVRKRAEGRQLLVVVLTEPIAIQGIDVWDE